MALKESTPVPFSSHVPVLFAAPALRRKFSRIDDARSTFGPATFSVICPSCSALPGVMWLGSVERTPQ